LVSVEGSTLQIKLANGKVIKAPLAAFSEADQEFVAAQSKPGSAPKSVTGKGKPEPGDMEPIEFEIWNIRSCCRKAKEMYEDAVKGVEGVSITFGKNSNDDKIIILDAKTKAAAKEALTEIAAAGLYGETTSHEVALRGAGSKAEGDMKASGVEFCCNKSVKDLEKAMSRTKGITEHTIKKSRDTFEIKGTATAAEVLRSARKIGFNFKLE